MPTALVLLLLILAIVLVWLDGARAREIGSAIADEMCRKRGYQLLDQTICLTRIGLVRTASGVRFKRVFGFDYSAEGVGRQHGYLLMHGSQAVDIDLGETDRAVDDAAEADSANTNEKGDDNVIPFRKRH